MLRFLNCCHTSTLLCSRPVNRLEREVGRFSGRLGMALPRNGGLYALTSLQIGDIQSYVSRLFLLVAYQGLKLVFLVDNGPWTVNSCPSRPAKLWQLLVYKSRGSPFANRLRDYSKGGGIPGQYAESSNLRVAAGQEKEDGWLSLLVALQRNCKEQIRSKKPPHGLYGCVAFEVAWSDVRGINYSNELQTDTCVSLEVKVMTKREFDSLEQARACYDTILSGSNVSGPNLDFSVISNSKTSGSILRRKASSNNLHGLGSELGQASKVQLDGSNRRKEIRKRKQADKSRSQKNGSCSTLISELSRAYMSSLTSRFGTRLDPVNVGSLPPEYFTPPSSPYSEQVLHNLFKPCSSHQHKDSNKLSIVSVDEDLEPPCLSESRIHTSKDAGEFASSSGRGVVKNSKSFSFGKHSLGAPIQSFDSSRSSGCARCGKIREGVPFREKTQGCVRCSGAEVRPDSVYVHPDRLIAVAETYRDALILFRFSEPLLPLELKRIITADRRLLKMLESGLPPWVIFLQSYPILSHIYRPWMRPLCGTVYYIISIVTVLIGFYDLYKNVPVLKATAAHICGPLFKWIEEWGMVSRLKYLGTMLFLQNCEKAFEWALAVARASRQVSVLVMRPFLQPLMLLGEAFLPLWEGVSYGVQTLVQFIAGTLSLIVEGLSHILYVTIWPFMTFLSGVFNLGKTLLYPVFYSIWSFMIFPVQLMRLVGNLLRALSSEILNGLENLWLVIHDTFQLLLVSGSPTLQSLQIVKSSAPSPSMWRTLWNDILSKVFHAVNGIVKGLAAFIAACNRHRLSIYNQLVEFFFRASHMLKSGRYMALTTCQNIFWMPDPSGGDSAAVLDEVESEAETRESMQPFSDFPPPMLRHRSVRQACSAPLLLMDGQFPS